MNGIIRVFPQITNFTPKDEMAYSDCPSFKRGGYIPEHKAVHVCCVFTWDKPVAERLCYDWQQMTDKPVKLGGPAYDDPGGDYEPGLYVRHGITFTSRGCPNNCPFCFVPKREGKIRELEIKLGNEIQDNNFLACSKEHRRKVYDMLRTQKQIRFVGGLEAIRLTDWDIEELTKLRIKELWLACDSDGHIKTTTKAINRLVKAGFVDKKGNPARDKIRCYALIGDDMAKNEARLRTLYNTGSRPFAQLYQPENRIEYSSDWKKFATTWSRPAAIEAHMKLVNGQGA